MARFSSLSEDFASLTHKISIKRSILHYFKLISQLWQACVLLAQYILSNKLCSCRRETKLYDSWNNSLFILSYKTDRLMWSLS